MTKTALTNKRKKTILCVQRASVSATKSGHRTKIKTQFGSFSIMFVYILIIIVIVVCILYALRSLNYIRLFALLFMHCTKTYTCSSTRRLSHKKNRLWKSNVFKWDCYTLSMPKWKRTQFVLSVKLAERENDTHTHTHTDTHTRILYNCICANRITIVEVERACNNLEIANSTYLTQFIRWNFALGLPCCVRNSVNSFTQLQNTIYIMTSIHTYTMASVQKVFCQCENWIKFERIVCILLKYHIILISFTKTKNKVR